ncbi:AMP dependent ligase/synthetase, putative [Entamoeba invadens IP1]|uniref:AMP dependent ligase/synthetase, putative n=1 Tax=Entamoeba invadens IP1 TaxID=370355 RepID=A0A0A1UDZ6_ENTIV|nr:AMP dependent ligase/synthetase, putative [Entamoeba invadens IP1]ELP94831.1 AMP dependent ligase/synthetase, putative [Entamoeba invadens IP1]|eukprot:XP_004261602.1 AMP dependent ligase/synthetase, putative [Entamoeba invadens IP1]
MDGIIDKIQEEKSIRIHLEHIESKPIHLFEKFPKTIVEALMCNQFIKTPAITLKDDRKTTTTWQGLVEAAFQCAYCLIDIKHKHPTLDEKAVLLCMNNCHEVFEIAYGCFLCGIIPLFVSPRTPKEDIKTIIEESKVIACFFDYHQKNKFEEINKEIPLVMILVGAKMTSNEKIIPYLNWVRIKEENAAVKQEKETEIETVIESTKPEDICEVAFVPSEVGGLKGVIWTHNNIISECCYMNNIFNFQEKEKYVSSFLNSFFFERIMSLYLALLFRFHVFISTPEMLKKNANPFFFLCLRIRPTIFLGVPRVYEKIIDKIQPKKGGINDWAMKNAISGISNAQTGGHKQRGYGLAMHILRKKLRKIGLSRTRLFLNCVSPLSSDLMNSLCGCGICVYDGLCLPETTGFCTINRFNTFLPNTLGTPINEEVKVEIDEGKVVVRGPTVACGYTDHSLNGNFTETSVVTGFTGHFQNEKNGDFLVTEKPTTPLIIAITGEYTYPIPIEERLKTITTVTNALVVGKNQKYVGALIFTNPQEVVKELKEKAPLKECIGKDPFYGNFVKLQIEKINASLPRCSKIKRFIVLLEGEPIGDIDDEKRQSLIEKYEHQIDLLFKPTN